MNGSNKNTVISFLDDLKNKREMAEAEANLAADPDIKLRRLQAAKDDGREKCLSYIFGQVCANSVPGPSEVPYKPAPVPDLDKVVNDFISSRTGGRGTTFYVKEAIKRNSECAKNLLESVEKLLTEMYEDKEFHPESITEDDMKFKMTPEVTDKLGKIIKTNNLDELGDVIKSNVRADAVDEVIAAKKEKDERMALEEELMNDPSITTPEQIKEAVDERYNPRDLVFYQPRLFEGILIKHFNEAASKGVVTTEASRGISFTSGSMNYRGWSVFTRVNDMFTEVEKSVEKYSERLRRLLMDEYREIRRRYYWDVMPIDIDKLCQKFSALISSGELRPNQEIEVIDTDRYIQEIGKLQNALRAALKTGNDVIDLPIRMPKLIPVSDVPNELRKNAGSIKFEKEFAATVDKFVAFAEEISVKYGRTTDDLKSTYKAVAVAGLIDTEIAGMFISNTSGLIDRIRNILDEVDNTQPMTEAFVSALYEYTMFNVSKALKLESFRLPDINAIALEYAQNAKKGV